MDAIATQVDTTDEVHDPIRGSGEADRVIREVMDRLGTPASLYRVTATEVFDNHFRVNIYCQRPTEDAFRPVVMTDSFFVELGDAGFSSQPPIKHRYGPANPPAAAAV